MFLPVYSWLDIVPKGRWVRRHDRYEDDGRTQPSLAMVDKS